MLRYRGVGALLLPLLLLASCSGARGKTISVGEALGEAVWWQAGDEVRVVRGGVHMLRLLPSFLGAPTTLTLSDGANLLLHLLQDVEGNIIDCHVQRDATKVATFLASFYTATASGAAGESEQRPSLLRDIAGRALSYVSGANDHPSLGDLTALMDIRGAEDSCRTFRRSRLAQVARRNVRQFVHSVLESGHSNILSELLGDDRSDVSLQSVINDVAGKGVGEIEGVVESLVQSIEGAVAFSGERVLSRNKRVILPGTNWCGNGNAADTWGDLGDHQGTDQCCRVHDQCPQFIRSMTTEFGLFNYRLHTLSACQCDDSFYQCLKAVNTTASNSAGHLFFDVMGTGCFTLELERVCVEPGWFGYCYRHGMKYVAKYREAWQYDSD